MVQHEYRRELHLELHSEEPVCSVTLQKLRPGHIPAWIIGGTGLPATNGDNNDPPADPLDDFIGKLALWHEQDVEEDVDEDEDTDDEDADEEVEPQDAGAFENHPPLVWEALPGDCITTIVKGRGAWVLAERTFKRRAEQRLGRGRLSHVVAIQARPAPHPSGDFFHVAMWIDRSRSGDGASTDSWVHRVLGSRI